MKMKSVSEVMVRRCQPGAWVNEGRTAKVDTVTQLKVVLP